MFASSAPTGLVETERDRLIRLVSFANFISPSFPPPPLHPLPLFTLILYIAAAYKTFRKHASCKGTFQIDTKSQSNLKKVFLPALKQAFL